MTTKEKILNSALKLFAANGIDKTSTVKITKDVGIASGTLFVHFKTKQKLVDTLYIRIKKDMFAEIGKFISPEKNAEENIKTFSRSMIEYFVKHHNQFVFVELVDNDPQVSFAALEEGRSEYNQIDKLLQKWINDGQLKESPLELMQTVLWSFIVAFVRYCQQNNIKKVKPQWMDILWDAVKR